MKTTGWQFEHSVECNADKSFAWKFWTDVTNWERIEGEAVEWIRLEGAFAAGTTGVTKVPGQTIQKWVIAQHVPECSATILMVLEGAEFYNTTSFESLATDRTRIVQHLSLTGPRAPEYLEGIRTFEESAPHGLARLARAIEAAKRN